MQGGGIDLHQDAGRDTEGLHLGGVQNAVCDLLLPGQQEDKVAGTDIDLAVPVVLQAVQPGVPAPAHAQLDRHPAVGVVLELAISTGGLQRGDAGLVGRAFLGQGDGLHGPEQLSVS